MNPDFFWFCPVTRLVNQCALMLTQQSLSNGFQNIRVNLRTTSTQPAIYHPHAIRPLAKRVAFPSQSAMSFSEVWLQMRQSSGRQHRSEIGPGQLKG